MISTLGIEDSCCMPLKLKLNLNPPVHLPSKIHSAPNRRKSCTKATTKCSDAAALFKSCLVSPPPNPVGGLFWPHVSPRSQPVCHTTTPHQFCTLCPQDGALARRVRPEVFQVYIIARMQLIEERVEVSAEQRMKEQLEHELSRLRSLDATERQTADAVQRVHDVLTLKCPRCAAAVFDFDGCFALGCPRCGCGFCAWCFKDCQADAHAHVRICTRRPARRDALFPARGGEDAVRDVFRPHHMRLHRQEVSKYLQELPSEVRKGVRQRLVQELKELQLYEE